MLLMLQTFKTLCLPVYVEVDAMQEQYLLSIFRKYSTEETPKQSKMGSLLHQRPASIKVTQVPYLERMSQE
jgi:hypothetical protein